DPGVDPLLDEAEQLALPTRELQRIGRVALTRAEVAWSRGDMQQVAGETRVALQAMAERRDPWLRGEILYWAHLAGPTPQDCADIAEPYAMMIQGDWEGAAAAWRELEAP